MDNGVDVLIRLLIMTLVSKIGILNIRMGGDFNVLSVQRFVCHNVGLFLNKPGIKHKGDDNLAVCRFRNKFHLGTDFFVVNQQRLACGFIH